MNLNTALLLFDQAKLAGGSTAEFAGNAVIGLLQKVKFSRKKIPNFQYRDQIQADKIRLFRFVRDPACDPNISDVVLSLETHEIGPTCPSYVALSYTWGPPKLAAFFTRNQYSDLEKKALWIDRCRFEVMPNLYDALAHVRDLYPPGTLFWADAICINQEDSDEKLQQIRIMDHVYGGAAKTVVWLGKKSHDIARAVSILNRNAEAARRGTIELLRTHGEGQYTEPIFITDTTAFSRFGVTPLSHQDWKSLAELFSRRWFGRAWMVQEVALSNHVEVLCGDISLDWDALAWFASFACLTHTAMSMVQFYPSNTDFLFMSLGLTVTVSLQLARLWTGKTSSEALDLVKELDFMAGLEENGPGSVLLKLVFGCYGFTATKRRDKFYAFHGILHAITGFDYAEHPDFTPDYSTSTTEEAVCMRMCRAIIEETGTLNLITLAGEAGYNVLFPRLDPLPSWVPDLQPFRQAIPLLSPNFRRTRGYDSGGSQIPPAMKPVFDPSNPNKLWVYAKKLGTVRAVGNSWEEMSTRSQMKETFQMLKSLPSIYAPTGQHITEAFWRVLLTDSDMAQRPAHDNLRGHFRDWLMYKILNLFLDRVDSFANRRANPVEERIKFFQEYSEMEDLATNDPTGIIPSETEVQRRLVQIGHPAGGQTIFVPRETKTQTLDLWKTSSHRFVPFALYYANFKRVFALDSGYLGSGPQDLEVGRSVWLLSGCPTPLILREVGGESFKVFGEAYVHGAMFGEAISAGMRWDKICLV
ncbi:uncharacterized protein NECHADRAFT_77370 [Fusarium vanettenii 77-13-4]|uniref:Heterokaryon incompatibility domain-containing protein n=1 Tax=Fusarium vanettenii (strain ATCC MYA-4622 / CBS 123669 / FGSC 9596 / NRRL 45880 / 77-13-4) TaxID=660122 RepID=C7YL17_FUSV7|nr:uncharacterized protein NECHADRAFT_77370 [Fusarium vanettenii 77-13-4]EEU47176.1 hypothetical protein NECHADRAFT_77370 [Fusarium vanettenii 77-13-4]